MKDIRATRSLKRLQQWIAEGEHETQDFKFTISDSRKIARSLSAFTNNRGGRLLIGVKDNGTIAGIRSEEDIYMVEQAAHRYCRPEVHVDFEAIKAGGNLIVVIASVNPATQRPVSVLESNDRTVPYYRVHDENIVAHPLLAESWCHKASSLVGSDSVEKALLALLDINRSITPESVPTTLHCSKTAAHHAIVNLAAAGLITFDHNENHFTISLPEP